MPHSKSLIATFVLSLVVCVVGVSAQSPAIHPPSPAPPPVADQEVFIAYWTSETGWGSELQLRNNALAQPLTVTPVLRSADGVETNLAPVTIQSEEVVSVDINAAIAAAAAPQLVGTYGSVALRFRAASAAALYAAVMIHNMGHPIAFHIDAAGESQNIQIGSREGIWWLPNESVSDYLILANQGKNTLSLNLSLSDASGKQASQQVLLGPAETNRLSIRKLTLAAGLTGSYGGIKISTNSHAGSLDSLHFLFAETPGFSATLKMFDYNPNAALTERDYAHTGVWTLRAPMLALSTPDPALALPPGTTFQPQLFVRNTTRKTLTANLRFNWRNASKTGAAPGPSLTLNPYETRRIDVAALQAGGTLPKDANWASVTLTTNGLPDELMAVAASYDKTLQYGAQTPFSDQLSFRWEGGMWQYDAYHDSMITVGNGGTRPTQTAFTIFYNQGAQRYDLEQTLQPDAQMWIDIGKLISEHVPDKNGNLLPPNLTYGSYEFRDLTDIGVGSLFEGKVTYDKTYGHAVYGCAECCGYGETVPWYVPIDVLILTEVQNGVNGLDQCTSKMVDVSDAFYNNWSSANTAIVTVDKYGNHTGKAAGSTTSQTHGLLDLPRARLCPANQRTPGGGVNVMPVITSISPDIATVGTTISSITINGTGFGSSPTVNLPQGVTFSGGQGSSDSQIIIHTVAISVNASIGPNSISVTVNAEGENQTSNKGSFTLDGPFYMIVQSDVITTCSGCKMTVARQVTYQVTNYGGSNSGVVKIGEPPSSQIATMWNCDQAPPSGGSEVCSLNYATNSGGVFTDQWSLLADGFTPVPCGWNIDDYWTWCPTGKSIGHLSGYLHNNSVNINGYILPPQSNRMPTGLVINP